VSGFSESIADRMLRNAVEVIERVERIIADPNHPAIYPFVASYLSDRPGVWVYAQEIVTASDDHFTLSGVGAVMGDLHDQGLVTTIGIAGEANRRAKWDTPASQVAPTGEPEL